MYREIFKPFLDFILSLILSIISLPFILIAMIFVKVEDGGACFYNAPRVGKKGKVFTMYKLRSMKMNSPNILNKDNTTFNSENDPRLTKVGRVIRELSIDELPQIWNVLKGDMAFIGPRPDLPAALDKFFDNPLYMKKISVKPGLTGYTQAFFRNQLSFDERLEKNVYYIDHLSFLLDCKIVFATIAHILDHKSVYRNK